jgi:hypothetical protein
MKGRLYNPRLSSQQIVSWKMPVMKESKNKILFIWDTSIPDKWHNISKKQSIPIERINTKHKNTLHFLEETQKYISCITKPVSFKVNKKIKQNFNILATQSHPLIPFSSQNSTIYRESFGNYEEFGGTQKIQQKNNLIKLKRRILKKRNKSKVNFCLKQSLSEKKLNPKKFFDIFENV